MLIKRFRKPGTAVLAMLSIQWGIAQPLLAAAEIPVDGMRPAPSHDRSAARDRSRGSDGRSRVAGLAGARSPSVPGPTSPRRVSLADATRSYVAHLDQTVELLELWQRAEPGIAAETETLLEAKETELVAAANLIEASLTDVRDALLSLGRQAQLAELDAFTDEFRAEHGRVREDLLVLARPATPANRNQRADDLLERLRNRKQHVRSQPTGVGVAERERLPSEPLTFNIAPPVRESTVTPAYRGGQALGLPGDLDPTPDVQITPEIQALAASLGNSPARIYRFVRNNTRFEPYFGSLKGSQATLETLAGNDYDLASLTIALLRAAGIPSRYVRGTVKTETQRALDWLGMRHVDAVNQYLNSAGISAVPFDLGANGSIDWFEIDRVWVEALVPHANYRGIDSSSGSQVWVPLDPAFKTRSYQPGISGIPGQVPFDETGYLAERTPLLAYEWYEIQVRDWLAQNMPNKTVADIPYSGPIVPESLGLLPASLPHETIAFTGEWTELPDSLRHRYRIQLLDQFNFPVLDRAGIRTVETSLSRVTVSYAAAAATAGLVERLGTLADVPAFLVTLTPELKIDGVVDTTGASVNSGETIEVRITYSFPGGIFPDEVIQHENRSAGDYHALAFDLHQVSDTLMDRKAQALIDANADVGTPQEDADALEGELLSLAAMRYWQRVHQGDRALTNIYQYRTIRQLFEVLASANTDVVYLADRPFGVTPGNVGVDSQRQNKSRVGIDQDQSLSAELFKLEGRNGSAQEHAVWEEVVHIESVSTIKALQYANETDVNGDAIPGNGDVLDLTNPGQTALLCPGFPSGAASLIETALAQGKDVKVPYCDFALNQWNGVGWIEEDPATGAGAYIISGFLAGGETTLPPGIFEPDPISVAPGLGEALMACAADHGIETAEIRAGEPLSSELRQLPPFVVAAIRDALAPGELATVTLGTVDCLGHSGIFYSTRQPNGGKERYYVVPPMGGGAGTCNPASACPPGFDPGEMGDPYDPCGAGGEPVSFANGNMFTDPIVDVVLNAPDVPLQFIRTYNSSDPQDGPLGFGWTHNYNVSLVDDPGVAATIFDEDGGVNVFNDLGGGAYESPPGLYQALTATGGGWTLRYKTGNEYDFDTQGRLVVIRSRTGDEQTLTYDGLGRFDGISDFRGQSLGLGYDGNDRIVSVSDHTGRTWTYGYDGNGNLASVSTPSGPQTPSYVSQYTYYSVPFLDHKMASMVNPRGFATTFWYYATGKVFRTIEPEDKTTTYIYQPLANETIIVDDRGFEWRKRYDDQGRIVESIDPLGNANRTTWDANNNRSSIVDELGRETSFTYDALGNVTSKTDGLNNTFSYTYDPNFSQVTSATDAEMATTTFTIDPADGDVLQIEDALTGTTTTTHNAHGQPLTSTDATGKITQYRYDANFYMDEVEDPNNHIATFTYDALGRRLSASDHLGNTRTWTYDVLGRVLEETDALLGTSTYEYDEVGNIVRVTDQENRTIEMDYDGLNQIVESRSNGGLVTRYEYDVAGCGCSSSKLAAVVDPRGRSWRFEYDARGWLVAQHDLQGGTTRFAYDAARNLVKKTHADGTFVEFEYDAANRLTRRTLSDGYETTFTYDDNGNTLTGTNPDVTITYVYDALNRMTSMTDSRMGGKVIQYTYDALGFRETMTDPESGLTTYAYDDEHRMTGATHPGGQTIGLVYDGADRLTDVTYPNGTTGNYGYDDKGRVDSIEYRDSTLALLASMAYGYDGSDLVTSLTDDDGLRVYQYDAEERLTGATQPLSPDETYTYDDAGNRTSAASGFPHLVNEADELVNVGPRTFSYDARGNVTQVASGGNASVFTWNPDGQLVQANLPGGSVAQYVYDPFGRRIEKNVDGVRTLYFYDQHDVLFEYDAAGTPQARYGHSHLVDMPWIVERGGTTYALHRDRLQSLVAVTDPTETTAASYSYDSFGNLLDLQGADVTPFTYTGRQFDAETGLYHYRARYYDPTTGRFLARDPEGMVDGTNLYSYALNAPTTYFDPQGTIAWIPILAAAWLVFEVASSAYDVYSTVDVWTDCKAGLGEKLAVTGGTVLGIVGPGGGYGTAGRKGTRWVIGKMDDLNAPGAIRAGEKKVADLLPDLGDAQANWRQNSSRLREIMGEGQPIRDASTWNPAGETGFLRAERDLLRNRGWTHDATTGYWNPP